MRLATIKDGSPDGQLVIVSRDHQRAIGAPAGMRTLQQAVERWTEVEAELRSVAADLEEGRSGQPFRVEEALAPLPRSWQWLDGSAFQSHGDLMSAVFGTEKLPYGERPLMYQGMSDRFLAGTEDAPFPRESDGIDFEGEFGVIVDRVPLGVTPERAAEHIRLVVLINDWSLRAIAPIEMRTGFGWVQAKPATAMAPIAVTPDELGPHWHRARVCLNLEVRWNGAPFGAANGEPMAFGFDQLIAHAACTRDLVAGTIIGSGTVSNEDYREVGSSCIAERRGIELLDTGRAETGFMRFGDRVHMEALLPDGGSVFGAIDQRVIPAPGSSRLDFG